MELIPRIIFGLKDSEGNELQYRDLRKPLLEFFEDKFKLWGLFRACFDHSNLLPSMSQICEFCFKNRVDDKYGKIVTLVAGPRMKGIRYDRKEISIRETCTYNNTVLACYECKEKLNKGETRVVVYLKKLKPDTDIVYWD